jgi:hypothetical protein
MLSVVVHVMLSLSGYVGRVSHVLLDGYMLSDLFMLHLICLQLKLLCA